MIAVMLIAGLALLVALCVGRFIAPSSLTLSVNTLDHPWPYLAGLSTSHTVILPGEVAQGDVVMPNAADEGSFALGALFHEAAGPVAADRTRVVGAHAHRHSMQPKGAKSVAWHSRTASRPSPIPSFAGSHNPTTSRAR
jgi:hypothetical protein